MLFRLVQQGSRAGNVDAEISILLDYLGTVYEKGIHLLDEKFLFHIGDGIYYLVRGFGETVVFLVIEMSLGNGDKVFQSRNGLHYLFVGLHCGYDLLEKCIGVFHALEVDLVLQRFVCLRKKRDGLIEAQCIFQPVCLGENVLFELDIDLQRKCDLAKFVGHLDEFLALVEVRHTGSGI